MSRRSPRHSQDPAVEYADIFRLPRWEPRSHPRMSRRQRAAQFAPFAALTGFEEMVEEEARVTERRLDLSDDEKEALNRQLQYLSRRLEAGVIPKVRITRFVPDAKKAGGEYVTGTEEIRKIDPFRSCLVLKRTAGRASSAVEIPIEDILLLQEL